MREIRLTYFSKIARDFEFGELWKIFETARRKNERMELCGQLIMTQNHFIQAIEGNRTAVSRLYNKIVTDTRHEIPVIVGCDEIEERAFAGRSMGFVSANALTAELTASLVGGPDLMPTFLKKETMDGLMVALAKNDAVMKVSEETLARAKETLSDDCFDVAM